MSFFLFLVVAILIGFALFWLFDDGKILRYLVIAIIGSLIITNIGTSRTCADGWNSPSIGKQGACSHHGGVVTKMNEFGWTTLAISSGILILVFLTAKKSEE